MHGPLCFVSAPNFTWYANSSRDLPTYVSPENDTAIIPNPNLCNTSPSSDEKRPILLIVVCSAVANFEAREAIRKTWMSIGSNRTGLFDVRTAFLLGQTINDTRQHDLLTESNKYSDIIQENFIDSYLNLWVHIDVFIFKTNFTFLPYLTFRTLKSVMMLKWVKTHCPQVAFLLKTDDDMFVNVRVLTQYLSLPDVHTRKDMIVGSLFCRVSPIKDVGSKW